MDLVVLGSRGYSPPRTTLLGSVSSQVVPEARCPVMILAARSEHEAAA
jgi:nucleotide-binding universal stress UspA family protein